MSGNDDFQNRYFAAKTNLEKVQLFIREGRYKVATRTDKPNLNGAAYLLPILDLPVGHECKVKAPRTSKEPGVNYVVEIKYSATILGADVDLYFKGFYGPQNDLILNIQSIRPNETEG